MDIWTLPYLQRKLLLIRGPQVLVATAKATSSLWGDMALKGLTIVSPPIGLLAAGATTLGRWAYEQFGESSTSQATAGPEASQRLSALQVQPEHVRDIRFPPGHPLLQHVYVGHPLVPDRYYTVADFHRCLFEHKCAEAVRLLMYLGAKRIRVERKEGWGKDFATKMAVPMPGASIGAAAGTSSESSSQLMFEARLNNKAIPALPEDLDWFKHEPTWQSVAEARLKFGLQSVNLHVEYSSDYAVNASLTGLLQSCQVEIGGSFERFQKTTWSVNGDFEDQA